MSVYKRGKYWVVQFNHNKKTYTRSSKSTRKRDALELERQIRQQLVDTQVLGHLEHINLYEACDLLLSTSKDSGAYGTLVTAANRFKVSRVNYFVRFGDNYNGRLNGSKILRFLLVFFPVANAIDFNNRGVMDNAVDGSYRH